MPSNANAALSAAWFEYRLGWHDRFVGVTLFYQGDLASIEALGFETRAIWPGQPRVGGRVDLEHLPRILAHPGVLHMSAGHRPRPALDRSVKKINVNGTVWTFGGNTFSGYTGKGVVIGIYDSGIDVKHQFFRHTTDKTKTRILRIWDQDIDHDKTGDTPPPVLTLGRLGYTYGAEFDEMAINAAANGTKKINHHDSRGHGTHTAAIAAGNGGEKHLYVGVAPEAELIIVKEAERNVGIDDETRFMDAIHFILNRAKELRPGKPVVINISISDSTRPPYGQSHEEVFLDEMFAPNTPRRACVVAAGNAADDGRPTNGHATIKFPHGAVTQVEIPLDVIDRAPLNEAMRPVAISFWLFYRPDYAGKIAATVFFPDGTSATAPPAGTPAVEMVKDLPRTEHVPKHHYAFEHTYDRKATEPEPPRWLQLTLRVYVNDAKEHLKGTYKLRLTCTLGGGDQDLEAHLYCHQQGDQTTWFRIMNAVTHVEITEKNLIRAYGGARNVITAGAYDNTSNDRPVAPFSVSGPIVRIKPDDPLPPPKPDILAPGVAIRAANSRDAAKGWFKSTHVLKGTSQAAPHVAGVIALMFEKNPNLTVEQVKQHLLDLEEADQRKSTEDIDRVGVGRLNGKRAVDNTPPKSG